MNSERPPAERQRFYFQYVTTPTSDITGTTLMLHFDSQRYFFGRMAEGTQRACIQQGVGIKKVRNIFLTGPTTWQNMGGLIGMILTMADVQADEKDDFTGKRPTLNIHGGPKLYHAIACARRFVFRTGMPLKVHEAETKRLEPTSSPDFVDHNINVWTLPIAPQSQKPGVHANGRSASPATVDREQTLRRNTVQNMFDSEWRRDRLIESRFDQVKLPAVVFIRDPQTKQLSEFRCITMQDAPHLRPDTHVLVRNPWPAALVETLPPSDNLPDLVAMSYIVKGHRQRGTFLPQKAKELGVEPGPIYARLAAGQSVTLDNGNVVTSDMVLSPPEPGKGMAVFDIPSVEYLEPLFKRMEELIASQVMIGVEMASWLLGKDVFHSSEFRKIISSLPEVKHFISSPDTNPDYMAFDSSAASLLRLSNIRPECFLPPVENTAVPGQLDTKQFGPEIDIQLVERGLVAMLQPKVQLSKDEIAPPIDVNDSKYKAEYGVQKLVPEPTIDTTTTPYDDIEIITLGTGSAVPSKYRNVSASLIRIPGLGNYLIDAGEGTLGQLRRMFPSEQLDNILIDLRMIWISHLHADHHLGTLSVILARDEVLRRRGITDANMYLISEPNMGDFIIDFASVQLARNCTLLACLNSRLSHEGNPISIGDTSLPIKEFATTKVSHCYGAQAVSITFNNGFKFSYSGDCRPSANFAAIGADSHVLLHEATFDDGMEGDALAKKHSTTGEALGVAVQMRAKHVILTHFSQRYQKIPMLNSIKFADNIRFEEANDQDQQPGEDVALETGTIDSEANHLYQPSNKKSAFAEVAAQLHICVAFDMMRVKVNQIRDMHLYYPAIEKMLEMEIIRSSQQRAQLAAEQEQKSANRKTKNGAKAQQPNGDKKNKQQKQQSDTATEGNSKGDFYTRINRNKGSRSIIQSSDRSRSPTNRTNDQAADLNTATTTSEPLLSNRARKRALKTQERKERKKEAVSKTDSVSESAGNLEVGGKVETVQKEDDDINDDGKQDVKRRKIDSEAM